MNSKTLITAAISAVATLATPALAHTHHAPVVLAAASADQSKVEATKAALRDLWIGHIFWVRNVVVAGLADDAAAQKAAEEQAVANAQAIAAAIEPFYGAEAQEALFTLLAGHYAAVKAYLDASIAKDADNQAAATTQLLDNAGEIARFLSGANPNLAREDVEGLLQAHGGHHIAQIQQLQAEDYAGEARTWADMTQHMYVVSDALADAIAKQFPASF